MPPPRLCLAGSGGLDKWGMAWGPGGQRLSSGCWPRTPGLCTPSLLGVGASPAPPAPCGIQGWGVPFEGPQWIPPGGWGGPGSQGLSQMSRKVPQVSSSLGFEIFISRLSFGFRACGPGDCFLEVCSLWGQGTRLLLPTFSNCHTAPECNPGGDSPEYPALRPHL